MYANRIYNLDKSGACPEKCHRSPVRSLPQAPQHRILIAWARLTLALTGVAFGHAETVDVFVLAGQSNMDARAHRRDLSVKLQGPQDDVRFFPADRWTALAPGSSARPAPPDGFGPELSFGRSLADGWPGGCRIALVKHARGGTSFAVDWRPGPDGLYRGLLDKVSAAMAALKSDGHTVELRAFVWMQGERDATTSGDAARYEDNLRAFIREVRAGLGVPELPIVIGRIKAPDKPFRDPAYGAGGHEATSGCWTSSITTRPA